MEKTWYERLGVPLDASAEEIHAQFAARKAELLAVAAISAKEKRAASQELARLNKAYLVLSNPARRRAYDHRLHAQALQETTLPWRIAHGVGQLCFSTAPRRVLCLAFVLVALQLVLGRLFGGLD